MKLIYSQLKKFLPTLDVEPMRLRDDLTMIGHFTNYFEEIEGETVFDLDIKVNRGDCLGYYGIARDLAVLYHLDLNTPQIELGITSDHQLPISITSLDVNRVMCLKLSNIKVTSSPDWLARFIKIHQINSVNNVVDLTNYIMFLYGIPNHAFDIAKTGEELIWENNHGKTTDFTTLDGTHLNLTDENLVISNPHEVVSTDFVGGKYSGTYDSTTDIIIEVAVYNPLRIRSDSRQHKTITEAGVRLEKILDSDLVPQVLKHLAQLIIENCNGQVTSQIFDYYPHPQILPQLEFDPNHASVVAGVNIPTDFALDVLKRLGFSLSTNHYPLDTKYCLATPPSIRRDITLPTQLDTEVIRFWGFNKIPQDQPLAYKQLPDITPKEIYLIESLKDKLATLGYDEVLSWPLVVKPLDPTTVITTQNSINSEYIYLRQSLVQSLILQADQYRRLKLDNVKIFETGKVFHQVEGNFKENNSLAIFSSSADQDSLIKDIDTLGLKAEVTTNDYGIFAEVNLDTLLTPDLYVPKEAHNQAFELTSQIITLDANLTFSQKQDDIGLINEYSQKLGEHLWQLVITDVYQDQKTGEYRYTFRASYFNLDDKTAKELHLKIFNLN